VGKFTAYLVIASCHSVSNHVMCLSGFSGVICFFQPESLALSLNPFLRVVPWSGQGLLLKVSRLHSTLTVTSHRIEFMLWLITSLVITDWQFVSSCSPRTGYTAAVSFHYRPVDSGLARIFTSPR
jgi:hypothetical protein